MKFSYVLNGIGWADVVLEINNKRLFLSPNDVSEPLIKLVDGILSLIYEADKTVIYFEWDEEPRIDKWKISKINESTIRVQVELFPDGDWGSGKKAFDEECLLNEFVEKIVDSMTNILKIHGFIGYSETWCNSDFPISAFIKLKEYLKQCHLVERKILKGDMNIEMICSDVNEELNILNQIFENL